MNGEFLDLIENNFLFDRCGCIDDLQVEIEYVKAENVEKTISDYSWKNVCLEKSGDFTSFLSTNHREEYKKWNTRVQHFKKEHLIEIKQQFESKWPNDESKQIVWNDIRYNLLMLFMINTHFSFYESTFFNSLLQVFKAGHIPCGWKGEFPQGHLMIY